MPTYLLTPRRTVILEKLTGSQPVKKFPSRNLKVHYRIHNYPPTEPNLSQLNAVPAPASEFLEIHVNL